MLLIPGMSATRLSWGRPFLSLLEQSFECIVVDNRGIGLSGRISEPFTTAELAVDAAGLLDALGIESAHVFGFSMGGMVAQELALAHPERLRSLTLGCTYCGGPESQTMLPANAQRLAEALSSGDRERVYRTMWELNLSPDFRADESRYPAFLEMASGLPAPLPTIMLQVQAIMAHDTSTRLPGLEMPTLVVHGTEDQVLGVANGRQVASLLPQARLEIFEDVGHLFWWEQPQRSAELIREYALA